MFARLCYLYLPLRNAVFYSITTAAIYLHHMFSQSSSRPSTSIPTGLPAQVISPITTQSGQQTAQPVSAAPNVGYQPTNAPGSNQTATAQQQQTLAGSRNDYMLLCSDDKGWLTSRKDMNVSQIRSDRELFELFRSLLNRRKSWARRFVNLKTIQRISFVKVSSASYLLRDNCNE